MRKTILAVMVLTLVLTCAEGISETLNKNMIERDFGDFIMTMDEDMNCIIREKDAEEGWFDINPERGQNERKHYAGIFCYWYPSKTYANDVNMNRYAEDMADVYSKNARRNVDVMDVNAGEQDGKPMRYAKLQIKDGNITVYVTHRIVSNEEFGSYLFIAITRNVDEMNEFEDILNSVKWNHGAKSVNSNKKDAGLITYSFDGFTMTFDADMIGELYEKTENQVYFQMFPFYDENAAFNPNINCVWNSAEEDLTKIDANTFASAVLQVMLVQYEAMGLKVENAKVLLAMPDEKDGKYAISYLAQYNLENTTLYMIQAVVSDAAFGTYTFTVTLADLTQVDAFGEIMNTIKWTK